ncbi:hypothetical protein F4604DRAFT_1923110 [Suillus subluteus]|nr:hypothetical protein F4604DRAFT_1923110 [Suillus subluteus]
MEDPLTWDTIEGPNKLVFEDDLDRGFESSQPATEYEHPPSPTLQEKNLEYFEANTDTNMGMDEDPVDRDFYVDEDVCIDGDPILQHNFSMDQSDGEYPSRPNSPPLHFPVSDNKSLNNQSVLCLDLSTPAITHDKHHKWVSTGEDTIKGGDDQVWDPEVDPEYSSNDAVLKDGLTQEDQSKPEDILPHALSDHPALLNGYLTVVVNVAYKMQHMQQTQRQHSPFFAVQSKHVIETLAEFCQNLS